MRILLVEDDEMLGTATAAGLKTAFAVDWCTNADDAEAALQTTDYDLVVLDIRLPGRSGMDFLKGLRKSGDNRPVLFLTAQDTTADRVQGLNAGADDYLVKPFALDELLARAAALMRRGHGVVRAAISCGDVTYDPATHATYKGGKSVLLSARESAVLEVLMRNRGNIISKALIEEHIYDWSSEEIESNTIEVHISALRRKLGKDLITTMRNLGYSIRH